MAKKILPLTRPLDEIKVDLEIKTEQAEIDLEILYEDAIAYENLIQVIMTQKRLSAEIASRWVKKNNYYFLDRNFRDHWYLIQKQPSNSS